MKRVLTVIESDLPALRFSIYADHGKPTELNTRGYVCVEDPEDGTVSCLRRIGLYDSNEDARHAAGRYAAERGRVMLEWHVDKRGSDRGNEPDLWAGAMPPDEDDLPSDGKGEVAAGVFSYPYYTGVELPSKIFAPTYPDALKYGPQWYIYSMRRMEGYTKPSRADLINKVFMIAESAGYDVMSVEVHEDDVLARQLYQKSGFEDKATLTEAGTGRIYYYMVRDQRAIGKTP